MGDKDFTDAIEAREVLYNLLALKAKDIQPQCSYRIGDIEGIQPSAEMLTSLDINPSAASVDIPNSYDAELIEVAIQHSHRKYAFTADNEVHYFRDTTGSDGSASSTFWVNCSDGYTGW